MIRKADVRGSRGGGQPPSPPLPRGTRPSGIPAVGIVRYKQLTGSRWVNESDGGGEVTFKIGGKHGGSIYRSRMELT